MQIRKELILELYKNLYRYGQQLKYTDKNFYFRYIRNQFDLANQAKQEQNLDKIQKLYLVKII